MFKTKSRNLGPRNRGQKGPEFITDTREAVHSKHRVKASHEAKDFESKKGASDKNITISLQDDRRNKSNDMVTPVKTQKLLNKSDNDSPQSTDKSPDLGIGIASTFGSPEIEVSWDFSCSQAPRQGSRIPRMKQRRRQLPRPLSSPLLSLHPRLLPDREMSEEERLKKVESLKGFYSELFKKEDRTTDVSTNGIHDTNIASPSKDTFFNDSSNDLIVACTQAVEEELFESFHYVGNNDGKSDINMNSTKTHEINKPCVKTLQAECANTDAIRTKYDFKVNESMDLKSTRCAKPQESSHDLDTVHCSIQHTFAPNQGSSLIKNVTTTDENLPKQASSDQSHNVQETRLDNINDFFDDSIDDIMIKCSQEIEGELLSKELQNIDAKKPVSKKHSASPLVKCSKFVKTNHKSQLFDSSHMLNTVYQSEQLSNKASVNKNLFVCDIKKSDSLNRPNMSQKSLLNKQKIVPISRCNSDINIMFNKTKVVPVSRCSSNDNLFIGRANQYLNPIVNRDTLTSETSRQNKVKMCESTFMRQRQSNVSDSRYGETDITALLNDDDAYLTSIDISAITTINNSGKSTPTKASMNNSKIYSQREIDAKRKEALDKLRRKRWKM